MKEFLIALLGGIGDFDVWLENNSEQECRDVIIPIVRQRDELLAALKSIVADDRAGIDPDDYRAAKAAISKCDI